MHHPTYRITHTTAFVTPVVEHWLEREIAQWIHHEGVYYGASDIQQKSLKSGNVVYSPK